MMKESRVNIVIGMKSEGDACVRKCWWN